MLRNLLRGGAEKATQLYRFTAATTRNSIRRGFSSGGHERSSFKPSSPLKFENGRLLIAKSPISGYYLFSILSVGVLGLITYKSAKSLYNYKERGWFMRIFWSFGLITSLLGLRSCNRALSDVIIKLWLKEDGKSVLIRRGFPINKPIEYRIDEIAKPEKLDLTYALDPNSVVGYPVVVRGERFIVPKNINKIRPDLFGAVFNNMEIQVKDNEPDITIEL